MINSVVIAMGAVLRIIFSGPATTHSSLIGQSYRDVTLISMQLCQASADLLRVPSKGLPDHSIQCHAFFARLTLR